MVYTRYHVSKMIAVRCLVCIFVSFVNSFWILNESCEGNFNFKVYFQTYIHMAWQWGYQLSGLLITFLFFVVIGCILSA